MMRFPYRLQQGPRGLPGDVLALGWPRMAGRGPLEVQPSSQQSCRDAGQPPALHHGKGGDAGGRVTPEDVLQRWKGSP